MGRRLPRSDTGELQVGSLIAYLSYLVQILMSVVMATFTISMIPRASVSGGRIQEVLDTDSSVVPPADPVRDVPRHGTLEMRGVGFHYPGAEAAVLSDITFSTAAGHTTAIVGSTGAGKTTLVSLVPRLFDATAGTVLVDGVDVRELEPARLWDCIGFVPQRPYLFSGTVASNLQFGKPDATEDEMWEALEVAQAADFVRAMPGRPRRPHRAGRHERVRRAAPAAVDRPGAGAPSRRSTSSTTRSPPSTSPPTPSSAPRSSRTRRTPPSSSSPSACRPSPPPTTSSCWRTVASSGAAPTTTSSSTCPTYAEIVQSQIGERSAA